MNTMKKRPLKSPFVPALLISLGLSMTGCEMLNQLRARDQLNKGVKAYSSELFEKAVEHFKLSVEYDPQLLNAQLYLATAYRAQWIPGVHTEENAGFSEKAIQTFERVLEQDPANINAMANIAGIYGGNDEPDQAKEWYRKRLEVDPGNPEPFYGIGTIDWKLSHDETGINGDAVSYLEEEERARVIQLVDEGVEALKQALAIDDEHTDALQYLNLMYRERAYLAADEQEKRKWQVEADKLALQALDLRKRQEEEAERARHTFGGAAEKQ